MPYTWNDNAMPEAIAFCQDYAHNMEEAFRAEHNLGDEPFTSIEAKQLYTIEQELIEIIASILHRINVGYEH